MTLLITNQGIFCEEWGDKDKQNFVTPLPKGIHHYYANSVLFADDLTLGGFLNTLYKYKEIIEHDFTSYLHGLELQPFFDQMEQKSENEILYTSLVLKHSCSINVHQVNGKKRNYVNAWNYTVGLNNSTTFPTLSLSLENLHLLKSIPFHLDVNYNLWSINPFEQDVLLAANLIHYFTLHDVIAAVMTDLTYCGYPGDNELSDCDWDKIKPIEELIEEDLNITLKSKKSELNSALQQEKYEKCSFLAIEIERLETSIKSRVEARK